MFIDRIPNEKEPAEKFLPKINESAARMRQLIQSMLAYSRLSQTEPELTDVDLGTVMTDVCRDFELVIEEKESGDADREAAYRPGQPIPNEPGVL